MTDGVIIRLANHDGEQPEFICRIHGKEMFEDKELLRFSCQEKVCGQTLDFHEIRQIAQRLRGYA